MAKKSETKLVSLEQHIAAQEPVVAEVPKSHDKAKRTEPVTKEQMTVLPEVKVVKPVPFRIIEEVRPKAGGSLFAFTQAWLDLSGMLEGKGYDRDQARKLAGNTAIAYHTKLENFEATKDGMKLTVKGKNFFNARIAEGHVDPKKVETFKAILTSGKMDGELVKNQHFVVSM